MAVLYIDITDEINTRQKRHSLVPEPNRQIDPLPPWLLDQPPATEPW